MQWIGGSGIKSEKLKVKGEERDEHQTPACHSELARLPSKARRPGAQAGRLNVQHRMMNEKQRGKEVQGFPGEIRPSTILRTYPG